MREGVRTQIVPGTGPDPGGGLKGGRGVTSGLEDKERKRKLNKG